MLTRRSGYIDDISRQAFNQAKYPEWLDTYKALLPEDVILEAARPYYSEDMGRSSEDPILLTKVMFLSFLFDVEGDDNTIDTLAQRLDWLQFCDLSIGEDLFDRTTLVKFRRAMGLVVIMALFTDLLTRLRQVALMTDANRCFDGTPVKACAGINIYRDEIYRDPLRVIDRKLRQLSTPQLELDFGQNPSPVKLEKKSYAVDDQLLDARRSQPMKPVSERRSAGDPNAQFQPKKHGKSGPLGYEIFFTTDLNQLFLDVPDVSAAPSQGKRIFKEKLGNSRPGQQWNVDGEFTTGDLLSLAEDKNVTLNTPPRPLSNKGFFPKTDYTYDPDKNSYTCPGGQTLRQVFHNKKTGDRAYRPHPDACSACQLRSLCTNSKTVRSINRSKHEAALNRNRERMMSQDAVMGRVLRGIVAEGKFAEAIRHGLKIMRYAGQEMVQMQATIIALILNLKRYARIMPDLQPHQQLI